MTIAKILLAVDGLFASERKRLGLEPEACEIHRQHCRRMVETYLVHGLRQIERVAIQSKHKERVS